MSVSALDRATESRQVTTQPCAKINLTLEVLGRRADGYHELRSVVAGVDLRDMLTLAESGAAGIHVECSQSELSNRDNLAARAVARLAARVGIAPEVGLHLHKRIPVAAGLGGGSSDAAAALAGAARLWRLEIGRDELAALGARVGSDVPLFFHLPAAVMEGRGERVRSVRLRWHGWVLLVSAGVPVSTAAVYGAFGATGVGGAPAERHENVLRAATADELNRLAFNELEPAVFRVAPAVGRLHEGLERAGFGPFRVSGAGSTLFRLFDDCLAAQDVAAELNQRGLGTHHVVVEAPVAHGAADL